MQKTNPQFVTLKNHTTDKHSHEIISFSCHDGIFLIKYLPLEASVIHVPFTHYSHQAIYQFTQAGGVNNRYTEEKAGFTYYTVINRICCACILQACRASCFSHSAFKDRISEQGERLSPITQPMFSYLDSKRQSRSYQQHKGRPFAHAVIPMAAGAMLFNSRN